MGEVYDTSLNSISINSTTNIPSLKTPSQNTDKLNNTIILSFYNTLASRYSGKLGNNWHTHRKRYMPIFSTAIYDSNNDLILAVNIPYYTWSNFACYSDSSVFCLETNECERDNDSWLLILFEKKSNGRFTDNFLRKYSFYVISPRTGLVRKDT